MTRRPPESHCCTRSSFLSGFITRAILKENKMLLYALLDEQSDACFIKESVLNNLHISSAKVELEISTVLARNTIASRKINGLVAQGFNEAQHIALPRTYTREMIPAQRDNIPRPETAGKWPHLASIADHIMALKEDIDVAILIGSICTRAINPRKIIPGQDDDPYRKRTSLGWGIVGIVVEAEAIVNSRHLTSVYSSSLLPLTPNHLLTLKSHVVLPPPGNFVRADSRKQLAEEFWSRWKKEFLQTLQASQKWMHPRRNLEGGDIALLKDHDVPRNLWRLARVKETYPSQDGLVRTINHNFIDIVEFYPSISEELLNKALDFASAYDRITDDERNITIEAKNSLLTHEQQQW
ncbi:hypothetical protein QZH41_015567 [Actinostola sp. cb2023]|nr:hypothetical protein QZH41_015567 [Actinostola sp. cb2023]